eukprot:5021282-Prymnesium_polylepis.1
MTRRPACPHARDTTHGAVPTVGHLHMQHCRPTLHIVRVRSSMHGVIRAGSPRPTLARVPG